MAVTIRFQRGLESAIPALADGEPGWATDSKHLFVGASSGNVLIGPSTATTEGEWRFDATSTTMADPGSGKLRINTALFSSATAIALNSTGASGTDAANFLRTLQTADSIYLQDKNNAANWVRYNISATPTNSSTWFQIPVTFVNGGGTAPTNNSLLTVVFSVAGGGGGGAPPTDSVGYAELKASARAWPYVLGSLWS